MSGSEPRRRASLFGQHLQRRLVSIKIRLNHLDVVACHQIFLRHFHARVREVTENSITIASCEAPDCKASISQRLNALLGSRMKLQVSVASNDCPLLLFVCEIFGIVNTTLIESPVK